MRSADVLTSEEEQTSEFHKQGNYKQQLLRRLRKEGQSLVYAYDQCTCIMNDGSTNYGVVVLVKTKPWLFRKFNTLEHGVDHKHLQYLIGKVPYIQIWIYEKKSEKLLMAYYHKLNIRFHELNGLLVHYALREEYYDVTPYLRGTISYSELPKPEL
jgi:hypothetical protein